MAYEATKVFAIRKIFLDDLPPPPPPPPPVAKKISVSVPF